jgi:hypothetical protein
MGELSRPWRAAIAAVALLSLIFIIWKSASPASDWMGEHLAEFLGAVASAMALAFIAYSVNIQARQTRSQELLTAFSLARPDLENLSRTIALAVPLVVQTKANGQQGRLDYWEGLFSAGDRTAFTRLFGHGDRIRKAHQKSPPSMSLRHNVGLYIQLFESVLALSREDELRGMLLKLPLGRAYCALKIAVDQDPEDHYLHGLKHLPREIEDV